jgi:hypothetical protein
VLGTDIQLLEVNRIGLEQLHVGEPDRRVAHERNPEATFAPCALQHPSSVTLSRTASGACPRNSSAAASSMAESKATSRHRARTIRYRRIAL